jgi:hydrogenase expression/formation protein HypC
MQGTKLVVVLRHSLWRKEINMCLGVPGKIIDIYEENNVRMGKVDFGGIIKEACLAYVPEVEVGDYTIIHVGFAITKLDEESARESLALFEEMGLLAEEFAADEAAGLDETPAGASPTHFADS